ncbi:PaaI family thioesterase [Rhodococcus sp. KRD162]|uniref:PaaI family thioesterase n=1 Tax=Rhodococcus sp. KRD162 TaxID=2729725 RepID=UPI0019D284B6|nr:PaaI family thioesterase [Rhodococcus sp. KRD162]
MAVADHSTSVTDGHPERAELAARIRTLLDAVVCVEMDREAFVEAGALVEKACAALGPPPSVTDHRREMERGMRMSINPYDSSGNPIAPPLHVTSNVGGSYEADFSLSVAYEGPPGRVHGGVVAGILDHACGFAVRSLGIAALSVSLQVDLEDATPYGEPLTVRTRVAERDGRKLWVTGEVATAADHVTARCRTLMLALRK